MVDIHNHILFGVDDGARTIEDSINMIKEEISSGVNQIILTPHFNKRIDASIETINNNFEMLQAQVISENINVELFLGSEVYMDRNYYETIWESSYNTLAGSRYLLVEFSPAEDLKNIPEICYEVSLKGYIPVIAHIERYEDLYDNVKLLSEILKEALIQVNAHAIIDKENKSTQRFVTYLLKNQLVSFVASDAHNLHKRGVFMKEAALYVYNHYGLEYMEKIFNNNQRLLIENKTIENPQLYVGRVSLFKKILYK